MLNASLLRGFGSASQSMSAPCRRGSGETCIKRGPHPDHDLHRDVDENSRCETICFLQRPPRKLAIDTHLIEPIQVFNAAPS